MKKFIAMILAITLAIGMTVSTASAHWVDQFVPTQVQQQMQHLDNDAPITRLQFCEDLMKLYEIVNGRQMQQGGLYVVPFSDCQSNAPYILATQGIVNGMSEGVFAPNATLTRAQCVAMVKRAMAPTRSGYGSFPDIQSHWAAAEIGWAAENNVVHGFPDGLFHPDEPLTVSQARKILYLAQKKFGWVGVENFNGSDYGYNDGYGYDNGWGDNGYGNGYGSSGSFDPTPQQGQGQTNPDGSWGGSNNGYGNGYNDGYGSSSNGGSFSNPPANGGTGDNGYTPSSPTNGGGF